MRFFEREYRARLKDYLEREIRDLNKTPEVERQLPELKSFLEGKLKDLRKAEFDAYMAEQTDTEAGITAKLANARADYGRGSR